MNALAFYLLDLYILDGSLLTIGGGLSGYAVLAFTFAVLNSLLKPILRIITFPLRWLTFGLFNLVLNAALVYILEIVTKTIQPWDATLVINEGLTSYVIAGVILAFINSFIHYINHEE